MSETNPNRFYVYVYLDPRKPGHYIYGEYVFDHEPFLVGKGSNKRAWDHLKRNTTKNDFLHYKIFNIRKESKEPIVFLYQTEMIEDQSYMLEDVMVDVIGRYNINTGPLCNLKGGGLGCKSGIDHPMYGKHLSDEMKKKLSDSRIGMKFTQEHCANMGLSRIGKLNPNFGKPRTEETKRKIGDAQLGEKNHMYGKKRTEEAKKKTSESLKGRTIPHDVRQKISIANRGVPKSEEHRKHLSERFTGKNHPMYGIPQSEEHIRKRVESRRKTMELHGPYIRSEEAKQKTRDTKRTKVPTHASIRPTQDS